MSRNDLNTLLQHLPAGMSEADLLDLIEGQTEGASGSLQRLRDASPDLAALVASMNADRETLRHAPIPMPTADIMAGVRSRLDADALLEPEASYIPVSQVEPARSGVLVRLTEYLIANPTGRRLSVAAGFALAGGLALWGGMQLVATTTSSDGPELVTQTDPPILSDPIEPLPETVNQSPTRIEVATGPIDVRPPTITIEPIEPTTAPITVAQATDAATTGRLAIRVTGLAPEIASVRLAEIGRSGSGQVGAWSELDHASESGLRSRLGLAASTIDTTSRTEAGAPSATSGSFASGYALRLGASTDALESFVASCEARGLSVRLVELETPASVEPPRNPRDVVWWTRSPDAWLPSMVIPVLIEQD